MDSPKNRAQEDLEKDRGSQLWPCFPAQVRKNPLRRLNEKIKKTNARLFRLNTLIRNIGKS